MDLKQYKDDVKNITETMMRFASILFKKTGLNLCEYRGPTHEEIENYYKFNGMMLLLEEILWNVRGKLK